MINIIIVDDCPKKVEEIKKGFSGNSNYSLDIAETVNEALGYFSQKVYDFAVIDLALPKRADEDPTENAGLELIKEINELDWYKKPNFTIVTTQHSNLKDQYKEDLEKIGVVIYQYDGTSRIDEDIKYHFEGILKSKHQLDFDYNAVFITALSEEAQPILDDDRFEWKSTEFFEVEDLDIKVCEFESEGVILKLALIVQSRMGLVVSAITSSRIIGALKPKLIIMPGICAGVQNEVNEGDIIVANPSWEWQTGKWKGDSFAIEPYQISVDQRLINKSREVYDNKVIAKIWGETQFNRPTRTPTLHVGPMVSGSSVISNSVMMGELQDQHRKLLGLEMEIFGVYSACVNSQIKPLFIGFKSVCDFGNEEKGDNYHDFCAELSAKFAINLLLTCKSLIS